MGIIIKYIKPVLLWTVVVLLGVVCSQGDEERALAHIPFEPAPYKLEEPEGFVRMAIPADNPMTEEGVALGRLLFYDPILSADSSLSCASCHIPQHSFADSRALSRGIGGREGTRNAPSLVNVGYCYTGLFWDGRVSSLEEQAIHPVMHPSEMGSDWAAVEGRLRRHADYPVLFRRAFGIETAGQIERRLVARALAQFQRTLISAAAKFDRVQRGAASFTGAERRGWEIFFDFPGGLPAAECGHCHSDPLFTDLEYFNNGLDAASELSCHPSPGRASVTGRRSDRGKFRTPTLRNIEMTAPYMHDGRFETLEEVVDHYVSGGHYAENVNPNVRRLALSERDKADLIAFLQTLTDTSFVNNPDFQNPFE
jgi:cytochrome c peroxidase